MTDELLKQVRVLNPVTQRDEIADVWVSDGKIQAIAPEVTGYPDGTRVRDCNGCVLGPGLVDLYSTVDEPGFESRETVASLSAAGCAGGFTRLCVLPLTHPPMDRPEHVASLQGRRPPDLPIRLQAWGALTRKLEGTQLTDLSELATAGICGFSDGQPLQSMMLVRRALEYLQPLQLPIALWPCDRSLALEGVIREGVQALQTGLPEQPTVAETSALAALLEIVKVVRTPIHIMRVSTARSVELIAAAKAQGLPVTSSVSWMHLLFHSEALYTYDVNLRLDPPLGNPADQAALIAGLEAGTIDAIAIDHRAYTYEEKTVPFAEAPPGVIGLELALPLLWNRFVATQRWSALDLWRKLSTHPLQILGHPPTQVAPDQPAEMVLFNPQQVWPINRQTLHSCSDNTPWFNTTLAGQVLQTWQNG